MDRKKDFSNMHFIGLQNLQTVCYSEQGLFIATRRRTNRTGIGFVFGIKRIGLATSTCASMAPY